MINLLFYDSISFIQTCRFLVIQTTYKHLDYLIKVFTFCSASNNSKTNSAIILWSTLSCILSFILNNIYIIMQPVSTPLANYCYYTIDQLVQKLFICTNVLGHLRLNLNTTVKTSTFHNCLFFLFFIFLFFFISL